MTTRKSATDPEMPNTLAEVSAWLDPFEPKPDATLEAQLAWLHLRAKVFRHVSETDPRHHHEALALAGIDERKAAKLAPLRVVTSDDQPTAP